MKYNTLILLCLSALAIGACVSDNGVSYSTAANNYKLTLDGIGLTRTKGAQRLDPDLWRGSSKSDVISLLDSMSGSKKGLENWPSAKALASSAITTPINMSFLTHEKDDKHPAGDLLVARIKALNSIGTYDKAAALYEAVYDKFPNEPSQNHALAKAGVSAMMAAGGGGLACVEVAALNIQDDKDPFWAQVSKRCAPDSNNPLPSSPVSLTLSVREAPENPSVKQILRAFSRSHANGDSLPKKWLVALDKMPPPSIRKNARAYALMQTALLVKAMDQKEIISRTDKIAKALEGDKEGQKIFKERVGAVFDALSLKTSDLDEIYGKSIFLTQEDTYVIPSGTIRQILDTAVQNQAVGKSALIIALVLSQQQPNDIDVGTLQQCISAAVSVGLKTGAEDIAVTTLLGMAKNL